MENLGVIYETMKNGDEEIFQEACYDSVEFCLDGLNCLYQFKLRNTSSEPMFFIAHEKSDIFRGLEVGKKFEMKYYSRDLYHTPMNLKTEISNITLVAEGRFRGHYSVGLSIVGDNN